MRVSVYSFVRQTYGDEKVVLNANRLLRVGQPTLLVVLLYMFPYLNFVGNFVLPCDDAKDCKVIAKRYE